MESLADIVYFALCVAAGFAVGGLVAYLGVKARWGREVHAPEKPQAEKTAVPSAPPEADLEGMLARSDDVAATLRDIVRHGQATGEKPKLTALLAASGIMEWRDAPTLRANRLRRNGRFWLAPDRALAPGEADLLMGVEAALNLGEDLENAPVPCPLEDRERVRALLAGVVDLAPRPLPAERAELLRGKADPAGEWACRMGFANFAENLPAPFRVTVTAMRANVAEGVFEVDAVAPGPAAFAFLAPGSGQAAESERAAAARAYALRLALLLARGAFESSPALGLVNVSLAAADSPGDVLLSASLNRDALARLAAAVRPVHALDQGLPSDRSLRWACDEKGGLRRVEPFSAPEELLHPMSRWREVELDDGPATPALAEACGAAKVSDLSLNEKAGRVAAWNGFLRGLDAEATTADAVGSLVALRDTARDLTVAEASDRTAKVLVEGRLDVGQRQELARTFVDGGALNQAALTAKGVLEGRPTPDDLEAALGLLDEALAPIDQTGVYLDDRDSVYRYFNSMPERVRYNLTADDGGRKVRLVPDEYYGAHSSAARILGLLDRNDEALAHANELCRVAPVTPDAALGKVRCLEAASRIFEARDVLVEAIGYASTARDLSILYYRLAFMEWKLGRGDLSVLCYQRSIALHPEMAAQAGAELADLLENDKDLHPHDAATVPEALEAAGLPAGDVGRMRAELRDAAVAATDAGLFAVARPLANAFAELTRDDALLGVCRSLGRP